MQNIKNFIPVRPILEAFELMMHEVFDLEALEPMMHKVFNLEDLEPMTCKVFNEALELTTCGTLEQTFFISHAVSVQTVDYVSHVSITR